MLEVQERLGELLDVVRAADEAIMSFYKSKDIGVDRKPDNSPVTEADRAADHIITEGFSRLFPDLPVVSEEGDPDKSREILRTAESFGLIDPLDNTRGFLKGVGEFAVCAAVVQQATPSFGVLSDPVSGDTYFGGPEMGSFRIRGGETEAEPIHVRHNNPPIVLLGRSSMNWATRNFVRRNFPGSDLRVVGSQLKLARIAAGEADIAPRVGTPFGLWDLAAGHAILQGAGGQVSRRDGRPINYRSQDLMIAESIASNRTI